MAEYREAIRLKPAAAVHHDTGRCTEDKGDLNGAIAAPYRETVPTQAQRTSSRRDRSGQRTEGQGGLARARSPPTARPSDSSPTRPRRRQLGDGDPPARGIRTRDRRTPEAVRLKSPRARSHRNDLGGEAEKAEGGHWTVRSPNNPRGHPTRAGRPAHHETRRCPCGPRVAWRCDRRLPRGDPNQARLRQCSLQPGHPRSTTRVTWRGRSPKTARPSDASPARPSTKNLGNSLKAKSDLDGAIAAYRVAHPTQAGPTRSTTTTSASPCAAKADLGSITADREAIPFKPDSDSSHRNLGKCAVGQG